MIEEEAGPKCYFTNTFFLESRRGGRAGGRRGGYGEYADVYYHVHAFFLLAGPREPACPGGGAAAEACPRAAGPSDLGERFAGSHGDRGPRLAGARAREGRHRDATREAVLKARGLVLPQGVEQVQGHEEREGEAESEETTAEEHAQPEPVRAELRVYPRGERVDVRALVGPYLHARGGQKARCGLRVNLHILPRANGGAV